MIFDDPTDIVRGEVVQVSEQISTVILDGEDVSLNFYGESMIANVIVPEARPSAAVLNGEAGEKSAYDSAAIRNTGAEDVAEKIECEVIFTSSAKANSSPVGVMLDGKFPLESYKPILALPRAALYARIMMQIIF